MVTSLSCPCSVKSAALSVKMWSSLVWIFFFVTLAASFSDPADDFLAPLEKKAAEFIILVRAFFLIDGGKGAGSAIGREWRG